MTLSDPNSGPETPEHTESLSATGMFLRAFESKAEPTKEPAKAEVSRPGEKPAPEPQNLRPDRPPQQGVAEPGEFTQMFQRLEPRQSPASAQQAVHDAPTQALSENSKPVIKAESPASMDQEPGEFTRIFVPGATPPANPSAKKVEEQPRPAAPVVSQSRAKGFSSPGVSDSASGEGSFTQFFKAAPAPAAKATPPARPSAPIPPAPLSQEKSWKDDPIFRPKDDPIFRPVENAPRSAQPSPSVTNLLSSLSPSGGTPQGSRQSEPAPYRPEPLPSYSSPPRPEQHSTPESAGVTQLIQRLSQEPPARAIPPSAPFSPPLDSGPGEFTRMISGLGGQAAPPPPGLPPVPAQAAPAAAPFVLPAAPAPPAAPAFKPPAIHAPAPVMPPVPKPAPPAPPPVPALAAPKGKLEGMVPILLVINTFLLIVILMVVIFSIKSR